MFKVFFTKINGAVSEPCHIAEFPDMQKGIEFAVGLHYATLNVMHEVALMSEKGEELVVLRTPEE